MTHVHTYVHVYIRTAQNFSIGPMNWQKQVLSVYTGLALGCKINFLHAFFKAVVTIFVVVMLDRR